MAPKIGYLEAATFIGASILFKYSDVNQTIAEPGTIGLAELVIHSIGENSFVIGDKQFVLRG
jgi:hypothetical protein